MNDPVASNRPSGPPQKQDAAVQAALTVVVSLIAVVWPDTVPVIMAIIALLTLINGM